MDLRPYIKNKAQLEQGIALIRKNDLFYQPFILADDVEVGEGQNFADRYANVNNVFDLNVYAPNANVGERKQAPDLTYFRKCNAEYRALYTHVLDIICKQFDNNISKLTFGEIGCNTGLNLFNLAVRGAKGCAGYDWNNMSDVFSWLNRVLGTKVTFRQGTYDNLYHRFNALDIPEVDVMLNTVFTNHQCDPLQFISYICDRARKGVFLWALTEKDDKCAVHYPAEPPHEILDTQRKFPLYFNNDVRLSEKLLLLTLKRLGFGEVQVLDRFVPGPKWDYFQQGFNMYYAKRTSAVKSAYWGSKAPAEAVSDGNVISVSEEKEKTSFWKRKRA
jgi:hypothetical protein